jgi:hypothetical protein
VLTAAGRHALAVAGAAGGPDGAGRRKRGADADAEVVRVVERMRLMLLGKVPKMRFPQRGKEAWELAELVEKSVSFARSRRRC